MAGTKITFDQDLTLTVDEEPSKVAETLSKSDGFARLTARGKTVYVGANHVAYLQEQPTARVRSLG